MKSFILLIVVVMFSWMACKQSASPGEGVPLATLANKVDPVCDMTLKANVKDTVHYQGKVYGFCNSGCADSFKEEPAKYAQ